MEHIVHLLRPEDLVDGGEVRQILLVQLEAGVVEQVGDIGLCADEIVVHADNVVALGQKRVDKVAADESGAAGNEDVAFHVFAFSVFISRCSG